MVDVTYKEAEEIVISFADHNSLNEIRRDLCNKLIAKHPELKRLVDMFFPETTNVEATKEGETRFS